MSLQLRQIVKRVRTAQFRRMNQTHEQITDMGPVQGAIELRHSCDGRITGFKLRSTMLLSSGAPETVTLCYSLLGH